MKRMIIAMSFSRKECLAKLENLSPIIDEHIMKCVIYSEELNSSVNYWLNELAAWMCKANGYKSTTKLKAADYLNSLFIDFGEDINDAEANLSIFQAHNVRSKEYPEFEITPELCDKLYKTYQSIIDISIDQLVSGQRLTVSQWKELLSKAIK